MALHQHTPTPAPGRDRNQSEALRSAGWFSPPGDESMYKVQGGMLMVRTPGAGTQSIPLQRVVRENPEWARRHLNVDTGGREAPAQQRAEPAQRRAQEGADTGNTARTQADRRVAEKQQTGREKNLMRRMRGMANAQGDSAPSSPLAVLRKLGGREALLPNA